MAFLVLSPIRSKSIIGNLGEAEVALPKIPTLEFDLYDRDSVTVLGTQEVNAGSRSPTQCAMLLSQESPFVILYALEVSDSSPS